jgi:superfamily I DNA/RNA helicase
LLTLPPGPFWQLVKLVKKLTNANLRKLSSESNEQWDARVASILRNAIAQGLIRHSYDAILIDEGQDLAMEWIESVIGLLNEKTNSLLFCLDPAQNIFGRKITYKSVGIKVQGKRPILLKRSYRNTVEILELASRFSGVTPEQITEQTTEENLDSLLFPMHTERHGSPPQIIENLSPENQIRFVIQQVNELVMRGACSWSEIGILYVSPCYPDFPGRIEQEFAGALGANHLYWITKSRESKSALDMASDTVKLSTIESAKGMEFRVVFLIGLDLLPRADRDGSSERSLAYVGMTRAQDALYILGATNTGFLREVVSISESSAQARTA